jgi:pimeloyl-ACP methyl ester carboxylesterase
MAMILIAHGAWSGGWSWRKMRPLMAAAGHDLITPTYTGLGERRHLAHPMIDLETHVEDVLNLLDCEELGDVVLLGHSYGGMVATGVADRARERIRSLIYLDAFVPNDGQCLLDLQPPEVRARMLASVQASGNGWQVPPYPTPHDTAPEDVAWYERHRGPQPLRTFSTALRLRNGPLTLPRSYIHCSGKIGHDSFRQFADRLRDAPGWRFFEMAASHSPHITAPGRLAEILVEAIEAA